MSHQAIIEVKEEGIDTSTGGTTASIPAIFSLLGFSDTRMAIAPIFDKDSQAVLIKVSMTEMGNGERQARKHKQRVVFDRFGAQSAETAVKEALHSGKAQQLRLAHTPWSAPKLR